MSFFKGQLLNHFKQLQPALERIGAEALLNLRSFALEVRFQGRSHAFHPQFVYLDAQGTRRSTSEFRPDVLRFLGWSPYFGKRWALAIEKRKFKEYALNHHLPTPQHWLDADADVPDVVVKRNGTGHGPSTRGPYRSSREVRLDASRGEFYERFIAGNGVKVWFWEGAPVCSEIWQHGSVCGDGKRSIRELVLRQARTRGKKVSLESLRDFVAYQGKSMESVPALDETQPVDFRSGSKLCYRSEVEDVDLRHGTMPDVESQLQQIGSCLLRGIPESLRSHTVFTVDAVLDSDRRLWVLSMNSNPFLHPYIYAPMIETWAKDPEGPLRQVYGGRRDAMADSGVGLH
jgi:hypothetical protein